MNHHAFVIEAEVEEGIATAQAWVEKELGMKMAGNPDVVVMQYGLLSVDDARRVAELASGAPFAGTTKAVIISASRAYHEAQNALLKVFEEPPAGTFLFLILPSLGGLLPTLRSRVQELENKELRIKNKGKDKGENPAEKFIKADKEERSAMIKKLTSGKTEEEKRELRDEAIAIVNGIEAAAYAKSELGGPTAKLLSDIAELRVHLYDRSAPVKMILEHLSLVIPKGLV